jgi:hypothetical protein
LIILTPESRSLSVALVNEEFQDIIAVVLDIIHAYSIFGCKPEGHTKA